MVVKFSVRRPVLRHLHSFDASGFQDSYINLSTEKGARDEVTVHFIDGNGDFVEIVRCADVLRCLRLCWAQIRFYFAVCSWVTR